SLFNFQFVAPTYPTKTVEYEYQFLGRDSAWHTVTRPNELFVSNLPLGKYRLAIRARQDGNYSWSKPLLFDFTVHEKWYKRAEVWFTVIVLLSITVVIIVRINIWKLRREKESLESIVAERTSEISLANDKLLVSQRKLLDSKKELEMVLATLQTINNHLESQTTALNSSAIVSMTDGEGYIFYVNEKFCEITGYSASELIGENHRIIKSGVHAQDFYVEMWSTIKTTTWRGEVCNRKKNGDLYWVDATIVPFFDAKGNAFQYMAIRFDISERKKYEKALIDKNAEIEVINQQIIDGINYASFIQKAILPPQQHLDKILPQNFVFYLPKNVVSGDFYWAKELGNKVIVVAGDCTGHGVPGALMSMLGMGILNDVSNHTPLPSASEILEFMRRSVKESLRQTDSASSSNDGMEMALCVYDKSTRMMQFAGARHTLMCRSGDDLLDYPGNLNPIGIFRKEKPFAQHEFFVKPGTWFYMFTDGYPDQFGGMLQKRFLMSRFRSMIGNLNYLSAEEQKDIVSHTFWAWAGKFPQVDDVLVIGFSFDRA
ncbi:MAG: hypothetical protein RIS47_2296, partial [Bacteroidota bacterium]